MKTTGIVRRIDDLGRVVIPKEIRRTKQARLNGNNVAPQEITLGVRPDHLMLCADGIKGTVDVSELMGFQHPSACDCRGPGCYCDRTYQRRCGTLPHGQRGQPDFRWQRGTYVQ